MFLVQLGHIRVEEASNDDGPHGGAGLGGMGVTHLGQTRSSANLYMINRNHDDLLHSGSEQHPVFSDDDGAHHNSHFGDYPSDEQRYARNHYHNYHTAANNDPSSYVATMTMEQKIKKIEERRKQMIDDNTSATKSTTKGQFKRMPTGG